MESDERLFEKLRAGELAAFDALHARWERRLFAFLVGWTRDRAEAEDALHETFLALLRSGDVDFARGSFKSWLYRVARNHLLNRERTRARAEATLGRAADEPPPAAADPPDARIERVEAAAALAEAVRRLPRSLAELYELRVAGLAYEEMARVLDVPVGTVKSRMHEMVAALRKEMTPWTAP